MLADGAGPGLHFSLEPHHHLTEGSRPCVVSWESWQLHWFFPYRRGRRGPKAFVGGPYTAGPYRVSDYFAAPGLYGTSYGFASYGVPRTFTTFSAYPGPSYGSNYPSYGLMPGRYGVGLWRPGFVAPGYVYGRAHFQHFLPYLPGGLRYRPDRQPDRSASIHRRLRAGSRSRNRALRPVILQSTGSVRPPPVDSRHGIRNEEEVA